MLADIHRGVSILWQSLLNLEWSTKMKWSPLRDSSRLDHQRARAVLTPTERVSGVSMKRKSGPALEG